MNYWGEYKGEIPLQENQYIARVIEMNREIYTIGSKKETKRAEITGSMRFHCSDASLLPVVGDWVICETHIDLTIITSVLPRNALISRKTAGVTTEEQPLAANIDVVAIVQGLDGGRSYTNRGLERYLTLAWNSGAQPLVILNKADLAADPEALRGEAEFVAPGVDVLVTSAEDGQGVEELQRYCLNKTVILLGPSGVGKSALTNALLGEDFQKTGANREGDKRGRHTTSSSRLVSLPQGGFLIDSPGLKEVQLWGEEDGVDAVFQEIEGLALQCRFRDCSHQNEPGCAIQQALSRGEIDPGRYQSYLELKKELAYLESRQNEKNRHANGVKGKTFSKMVKTMKSGKVIY